MCFETISTEIIFIIKMVSGDAGAEAAAGGDGE